MSIASIVRSCLENYSPNWFRSFAKKVIKFLLILKGLKKYRGNKVYIKDRQTIVVSHEASATGAPILALYMQRIKQEVKHCVDTTKGR